VGHIAIVQRKVKVIVAAKTVTINRAPVLTLWAAIVAERLGFNRLEALTLGRAVAGLNAQSKGRRLGIFKPHEEKPTQARQQEHGKSFLIELLGRVVPAVATSDGIRAVTKGKPVDPESVTAYLTSKFGDDLPAAQVAMRKLARRYKSADLAGVAYRLYEQFRPGVPEGKKGWGAVGRLDLSLIEGLNPDP
jgi:hypothetical protein